MKYLNRIIFSLLTISSCAFGQENKVVHAIFADNRFLVDSMGYQGQTAWDTIYYLDKKIQAIGEVALEKDSTYSDLKVGLWRFYSVKGQIICQGNFQMDSYITCCISGPCRQFINYKTGAWTYYYENGQLKTTGIYLVKKEKIRTTCKGGDKVNRSHQDKTWSYYTNTGEIVKPSEAFINEIENACR